jgi:hypothetical protein
MRYTLTVRDEDYAKLRAHLSTPEGIEAAAYVLCGRSVTSSETRLLVRAVVPVEQVDYLSRQPDRLSIMSRSYAEVAKQARACSESVLFVHSHPSGRGLFSGQDDREEPKLMDFLASRAPDAPHGSLVIGDDPKLSGRVWQATGWVPIERVRVLGDRFRFLLQAADSVEQMPDFFDRQVRAFGFDIQRLLGILHVGVVGLGGTGSAIAEQLCRLGVGAISLFDGEALESSNLSRVYGSTAERIGYPKVQIVSEHLKGIGLNTIVHDISRPITHEEAAKSLRDCDVVFGCTDRQAPRAILTNLSLYYLIPVFDVGVKIDAPGGVIRSVDGRLTILWPGYACLFCRGRISSEVIELERLSPDEQRLRAEEGYTPALETQEPSVIGFTTSVAARAVMEFLQRLSGWMGSDTPSEFLLRFDHDETRSSSLPPSSTCYCGQRERWASGDRLRFLDLAWAA